MPRSLASSCLRSPRDQRSTKSNTALCTLGLRLFTPQTPENQPENGPFRMNLAIFQASTSTKRVSRSSPTQLWPQTQGQTTQPLWTQHPGPLNARHLSLFRHFARHFAAKICQKHPKTIQKSSPNAVPSADVSSPPPERPSPSRGATGTGPRRRTELENRRFGPKIDRKRSKTMKKRGKNDEKPRKSAQNQAGNSSSRLFRGHHDVQLVHDAVMALREGEPLLPDGVLQLKRVKVL